MANKNDLFLKLLKQVQFPDSFEDNALLRKGKIENVDVILNEMRSVKLRNGMVGVVRASRLHSSMKLRSVKLRNLPHAVQRRVLVVSSMKLRSVKLRNRRISPLFRVMYFPQ